MTDTVRWWVDSASQILSFVVIPLIALAVRNFQVIRRATNGGLDDRVVKQFQELRDQLQPVVTATGVIREGITDLGHRMDRVEDRLTFLERQQMQGRE